MWPGSGATKWQGRAGLGAELPAVLEKGTGFIDHRYTCGQVAQSVEQGTENPRVGSSILSLATISLSFKNQMVIRLILHTSKQYNLAGLAHTSNWSRLGHVFGRFSQNHSSLVARI